jgi:hypothetical protein
VASPERVCDIKPLQRRWIRLRSETDRHSSFLRRVVKGGLASAVAVVGLVAFATPAFAHDNIVSATASCASPVGSGYTIDWTVQNDYNATESGSVTSVTGGLSTLSSTTFSIAASPGQPYSSTTVTQSLPPSASGLITIDISSTWSDSYSTTDVGTYDLSQLHCAAPNQTIAGHIYLCNNANPTTTEQTGGTVAATGATPVSATPNPLAPTEVGAGTYTMTATPPPGYQLVTCGGSSTPSASGSTATESVTVPSGGAGVGIFYVVATNPVTSPAATSTGSGGLGSSGGSSSTTPTGTISTTPPAATTSSPTAATSALAFSGAPLSSEWLLGLGLVLLGSVLLALGHWRREVSGRGWLGLVGLPRARSGFANAMPDCQTEAVLPPAPARSTVRPNQGPDRLRRPRC